MMIPIVMATMIDHIDHEIEIRRLDWCTCSTKETVCYQHLARNVPDIFALDTFPLRLRRAFALAT